MQVKCIHVYSTNRVINEAVKAVKSIKKLDFSSNVTIFKFISMKLKQADDLIIFYMYMVECPPYEGYLLLTVQLCIY